ncbi:MULTISPECIES: septation ring formation regulator EzrA [Bacillus]|uniref:septation ring formation regulator EzrA n=1 Tax=Bacillus TaxID=1386 RepID=UPI00030ADDCD|nr:MULTISPECIES: septation ring formation regulator EzrA [Bacillus]
MEYILGLIVLVLGFFIIGYFFKKKRYTDIDKLEEWKMNIMNRPVLDELSKVKQLNMTGETEEMFEKWRNEWDEIVTVRLPDVEEMLFDAEEFIDKYRFSKSKAIQRDISAYLREIEGDIQSIIDELNDLVGSEEKNRLEIEELKESYRTAKKQLLAHRHTYGRAADKLESCLDDMVPIFSQYEEATANGNYLHAREHVLKLKSVIKDTNDKMNRIPDLLLECNATIPNQVKELKDGYEEMLEKGYILSHMEFSKELQEIEEKIDNFIEVLEKAEIEDAEKGMEEVKDSIGVLYELLEKEVLSRQYVHENQDIVKDRISNMTYENDKLKMEIHSIQSSYHISEEDMKVQRNLDRQMTSAVHQLEKLQTKVEQKDIPYSILADSLAEVERILGSFTKEYETLSNKLRDLRKDELEAREKIKGLTIRLHNGQKWLTQYNVPGVPEEYKKYLEEALLAVKEVNEKLEEKPLNMGSVQVFLEKAVKLVDEYTSETKELVEQVLLIEKVIQYSNRYRSRYPSVQASLQDAENKFRNFEYEAALETAASVLEEIDPGVLKSMKVELDYDALKN